MGSPDPPIRGRDGPKFPVDDLRTRADTSPGAQEKVPFFTSKALAATDSQVRRASWFFLTSGGGSVQRMNRHSIKLLVTLVLLILAATSAWMTSQAEARGLDSPGASSQLSAMRPDASLAAGDPDAGQGVAPPPPPSMKQRRGIGNGDPGRIVLADWVRWTGRIWATLNLRTLR